MGQALSDTQMKDMLLSLRSSLHDDMQSMLRKIDDNMQEMGDRLPHTENKMAEFATAFNDLVDSHNSQTDEVTWLKSKVSDLEDRSRQNNLKIRGIPESVKTEDLATYTTTFFKALLPDPAQDDLLIDRIHRIPKPNHISDNVPRDVLLCIHFYHIKDHLMQSLRSSTAMTDDYSHLLFFSDLSTFTLLQRHKLAPITRALRSRNIRYRFPLKLLVTKDNTVHQVLSFAQGKELLNDWNIPVELPAVPTPTASDNADCHKVSYKKSRSHKT